MSVDGAGGQNWFFFFSSRRRHTRWPRDWSSDVCSSDLELVLTEPDRSPWRFVRSPDDPDRWRGTAGEQVGEVLQVRRDADGTATALDIATIVYTRDAGTYTA